MRIPGKFAGVFLGKVYMLTHLSILPEFKIELLSRIVNFS
jgi:hypothetical protein